MTSELLIGAGVVVNIVITLVGFMRFIIAAEARFTKLETQMDLILRNELARNKAND